MSGTVPNAIVALRCSHPIGGQEVAVTESADNEALLTELNRMTTGVMRLDDILQGGLIASSVYLVVGPSGSGKTILAAQIASHHIRSWQGQTLYISLLAETHLKLVSHLAALDFFDPRIVGTTFTILSGYSALKDGGLTGLEQFIVTNARDRKADIVIVDGLDNAAELATSNIEFREFVLRLQSIASLLPCTVMLLSLESNPRIAAISANVDGIIGLSMAFVGTRMVRQLTVTKMRGTSFLPGHHFMTLSQEGVIVHPLMEVRFGDSPPPPEHRERHGFGVASLDAMLGGGLMADSSTLLVGAPGTGKTLMGLAFLVEGARRGEQGLHFGFYEAPNRLMHVAESIGLPLRRYVESGAIELLWNPPAQTSLDALSERLLERIMATGGQTRRVVVDGLAGMRLCAIAPARFPHVFNVLTNRLRAMGACTIFTEELALLDPAGRIPDPNLASIVDSVLMLRFVEMRSQLHRMITVLKLRETDFDRDRRELRIDGSGLHVAVGAPMADDGLSGEPDRSPPDEGA